MEHGVRRTERGRIRSWLASRSEPRRWLLALVALLLLTGAASAPVGPTLLPAAQQRSMVVEDFHSLLQVREDGTLDVLESIRLRFDGSWNRLSRTIPVAYELPEGWHALYVDMVSAVDEEGRALEYEIERERYHQEIRIHVPGAVDATRTVSLRYTVPNGLRFFENHDELYWNVTGNRWEVPILHASARVELPDGATGFRATAYTGTFGSRSKNAESEEIEEGFYFETGERLEFREGLTVVVGWDRGAVDRPGVLRKAGIFATHNWFVAFPLFSLLLMGSLWYRQGRDPRRRGVPPRYEPPEGLTPAEAGTLIDNSPDLQDITASLVDLAIRGYLRIEERPRTGIARWLKGNDYEFVRLEPTGSWEGLTGHERHILKGIFDDGRRDRRLLSDLTNEFYEHLSTIRDDLFRGLRKAGFYRHRPDEVKQVFVGVGVVVAVTAFMGAIFLAERFALPEAAVILAALATAAPVFLFGPFMPARSVRGTRKLEEILGFEEFLTGVESDRYRRMIGSPEQFERCLPYAMAFGVEERWARAFEDIYTGSPEWYVATGGRSFGTTALVGHLGDLSVRASAAMTSAPRGSGGSGFSGGGRSGGGGGFSGGGFGGGGSGGL